MPIMFNTLFGEAGLPLSDVRLLRHKDSRSSRGRTPYELWRDNKPAFDTYQSVQGIHNRKKLSAPFWAVFIADRRHDTMFAGIYAARYRGLLDRDVPRPHMDGCDVEGSCDWFDLTLTDRLEDLSGRLIIRWGEGALAWIQRADRNNKAVTEVRREFQEPAFPGYLEFIKEVSDLEHLPRDWVSALCSSRGVYLLTCPRTKEQYVGSATGEDGFWGRWRNYAQDGHGGNLGLKSREPSDYQVSILEVAGSAATADEIRGMEGRWQVKLQSREMGLNRNRAGGTPP